MTLGEYIKSLRNQKNASQEKVSRDCEISLEVLQALETDATDERDIVIILKLSRYFDKKPSSFVNVDAKNVIYESIDKNCIQRILDFARYAPKDRLQIINSKKFIPWGKEQTCFIVASEKYNVYFKVIKSVTIDSLFLAFDLICEENTIKTLTTGMYLPTGERIDGHSTDSHVVLPIGVNGILLRYHNSSVFKSNTLSKKNNELKLSARGGDKTKLAPKTSTTDVGDLFDEIDGNE